MIKYLYFLLSRRNARVIAVSLRHYPEAWYNHVSELPGMTHLVSRSLEFSLFDYQGELGCLDREGRRLPVHFRWAERRLLRAEMVSACKSAVTVDRQTLEAFQEIQASNGAPAT